MLLYLITFIILDFYIRIMNVELNYFLFSFLFLFLSLFYFWNLGLGLV